MLIKVLAVAASVIVGAGIVSEAQTLSQITAPNETPPASFTGNQYVDSRGCVFVRAGYGGQVTWIPRVSKDRKVLCGYPPSLASMAGAPAAQQQAVAPQIEVPAPQPRKAVAAAPMQVPAAVVAQAAAPATPKIPVVTRQTACSEPSARRYKLSNGKQAVRCGAQEGYPNGFYMMLADPVVAPAPSAPQMIARVAQPKALAQVPVMPKGYKPAWTDDRLNPKRGVGTAAGEAAMDMVWTRETPRRLVNAASSRTVSTKGAIAVAATKAPRISTKTAPTAKGQVGEKASGALYVQVGSFGLPANAKGASLQLRGLGLPVATRAITRKGKALQIVYAGPFSTQNDAGAALAKARRAGFNDAFIR